MMAFLYHYIRSMRLYYGFVTATSVLAGIMTAHATAVPSGHVQPPAVTWAILLAVGFLAWGANQIFSDYLDRKEDAINAPHRPMVTGALALRPALLLSSLLMIGFAMASAWVSAWTLPVLLCGAVLNGAYSWLKKVPLLNCFIYACAISCCATYGYAGITHGLPDAACLRSLAIRMVPVHCLMCHNSYYKDVVGDRAAGVRTLQTCFPRRISLAVSAALFAAHVLCSGTALLHASAGHASLLFCIALQGLLLFGLAALLLRCLLARSFHKATRLNCELCVGMLYTSLLSMESLLLIPEILSLLSIEALFLWYRDEKE